MAEGEKKRFGNFAEYAKARQATKEQMPATGPGDQPRYIQQGMGIMGAQPGGMPVSQGMQQRTMGMGGIGGGMPSMQMNRGPMGMQQGQGMSLGMNRGGNPQSFSFDGQQNGMQGMGRGMQGGLQGGQGYGPSGMGGSAHQGMGGGMRGNAPNGNVQIGMGGYDGPSQVAFDPSDFPVLGRNPGTSSQSSHSQPLEGSESVGSSSLNTQKEFSMEEDFPALPGAQQQQGPNNSLMTGGASAPGMVEQFQRMKLENQAFAESQGLSGGNGSMSSQEKTDRYGMLGLLSVIRMNNDNLTLLALGTDLTRLGLNLNAPDNLYETFYSPWDVRAPKQPDYQLPRCYSITPPALKTAFFKKFSDMTLFYIFYHFLSRPHDAPHQELRANLVKFAYTELAARGWQYQQDSNIWITRTQSTNELKYFDMQAMELRPFVGTVSHKAGGEAH
mmetsp:Transcript_22897/g.74712  ORF Transcript_22897/g.74712 Transcript_22897/m.74712 type:complete len:443 (-) Transcript_22897:139-1467(-)